MGLKRIDTNNTCDMIQYVWQQSDSIVALIALLIPKYNHSIMHGYNTTYNIKR